MQSRPEGERPWSILQDVSTRWNSQLFCLQSCLKSEGALRAVLASEEFKTMKSLVGEIQVAASCSLRVFKAGVKFGQSQVELLKRVCRVLEPFYHATLQLSNDGSCISEVCKCDGPLLQI